MAETSPEYLAGLIVGIKEHLDRQDAQHASDKAEAIRARDEKHQENVKRFDAIDGQITETKSMAVGNKEWIEGVGKPLVGRVDGINVRVTAIEDDKKETAAEGRGRKAAFGLIYAVIGAGLTMLGAFGTDAAETIKRFLHGG